MQVKCLGSSSSGNCYLLTFTTPDRSYKTTIMVECGLQPKEIYKRAVLTNSNEELKDCKAIIITHNHSDHCCGLKGFNNLCDIYASSEVIDKFKGLNRVHLIDSNNDYCIAEDLFVHTFNVEHDAPNSLGFVFYNRRTDETILFVNDCKYFKADLSQFHFNYVFMECNYLDKQVRTIYHNAVLLGDKNQMAQYKRVIDVHMSLAICKKTLLKLNLDKCKAIFLMHLSDRNANEYIMKNEVSEATKVPTFVCQKIGGVK